MEIDEKWMRRALQLARCGISDASPNPMVGAVIVHDGKIIGEGYHRRCGEGHAEVNAVASVADKGLLADSTMYVTLEPCSHYGKTPPCAKLIIDSHIPRVVVGCLDPFEKVSGRGVGMLRDAGTEVVTGVLQEQCMELNRRFMTAHTGRRPFITLKWAQSADGYLDAKRSADRPPMRFSTPVTSVAVHRLRSLHDAILVGSGTVLADNPRLDARLFDGRQPVKVILDRRGRVPSDARVFTSGRSLYVSSRLRTDLPDNVQQIASDSLSEMLSLLYERGITSVLVEGGGEILRAFLDADLWDEARIETVPGLVLGAQGSGMPMTLPDRVPYSSEQVDGNMIICVKN